MAKKKRDNLYFHVTLLAEVLGGGKRGVTAELRLSWEKCLQATHRAVAFADLETLAPMLRELDALREALETAHANKPVARMAALRGALDGMERFIDTVPLAPLSQRPPWHPEPKSKEEGVLLVARKDARRRSRPSAASGSRQATARKIRTPLSRRFAQPGSQRAPHRTEARAV